MSVSVQTPGLIIPTSLNDRVKRSPCPVSTTSDTSDLTVFHNPQMIKRNPGGQFTSLDSILVTYSSSLAKTTDNFPTVLDQSTSSAGASGDTNAEPTSYSSYTLQASSSLSVQQFSTGPVLIGGHSPSSSSCTSSCRLSPLLSSVYRRRGPRSAKQHLRCIERG